MLNYGRKILRENCASFAERRELETVLESNGAQLDATMVSRLYKSAIDKSHVVDSWEDSKGDITKFEGYIPMKESLQIVENLSDKAGVNIPELMTINETLNVLEANRESFVKGFMLNNELVTLIYNTIVYACVEATSSLISSYVEYVRNVNTTEFTLVKTGKLSADTTFRNLKAFNQSHKKGDLTRILKGATNNRENFLGVSGTSVAIGAVVIGAALSVVPIIRELIFTYYYTRSRMSDYLEHQALLIELNRKSIETASVPLKDRKKVIEKQTIQARQFRQLSERIKVSGSRGEIDANTAIKQENKTWKIEETKKQMIDDSSNGFQLL